MPPRSTRCRYTREISRCKRRSRCTPIRRSRSRQAPSKRRVSAHTHLPLQLSLLMQLLQPWEGIELRVCEPCQICCARRRDGRDAPLGRSHLPEGHNTRRRIELVKRQLQQTSRGLVCMHRCRRSVLVAQVHAPTRAPLYRVAPRPAPDVAHTVLHATPSAHFLTLSGFRVFPLAFPRARGRVRTISIGGRDLTEPLIICRTLW